MFRTFCINLFAVQNRRMFSVLRAKRILLSNQLDPIHSYTLTLNCTHFVYYYSTNNNNEETNTRTDQKTDNALNGNFPEIQKLFQCTDDEASEVYDLLSKQSDSIDWCSIRRMVKWLQRLGATLPIIMKNCHILQIPKGEEKNVQRPKYEHICYSKL